jgi:hypothetical protein
VLPRQLLFAFERPSFAIDDSVDKVGDGEVPELGPQLIEVRMAVLTRHVDCEFLSYIDEQRGEIVVRIAERHIRKIDHADDGVVHGENVIGA